MKGIDVCSYEEFQYALSVGVTAPFYLVKLFMPHLSEGASIINISSSRDRMSQPQTESYTAAKGGISALTHALAVSFAGRVRVNSISPGWIDNDYTVYEGADAVQQRGLDRAPEVVTAPGRTDAYAIGSGTPELDPAAAADDELGSRMLEVLAGTAPVVVDAGALALETVHLTGRNVVQIGGEQDGGAAAKVAGQVVKGQGVFAGFQGEVTCDLPYPGIRGHSAQNLAVVLPVDQEAEGAGVVGAEPVPGSCPDPVSAGLRNGDRGGGILHGNAGHICRDEVTAAHQMNELGVDMPAALVGKVYSIQPKGNVFIHRY